MACADVEADAKTKFEEEAAERRNKELKQFKTDTQLFAERDGVIRENRRRWIAAYERESLSCITEDTAFF